jgi:serine/threonine protein kinase
MAEDGSIKLTDFGLSRIMKSNSRMQTLVGTPQYTGPSHINSHKTHSYSSRNSLRSRRNCFRRIYESGRYMVDGCDFIHLVRENFCTDLMNLQRLGGYPPFGEEQVDDILQGKYEFDEESWKDISSSGNFLSF